MLSNRTVNNLTKYYNHQATKYHQTRRKFWHEKKILQEVIKEYISSWEKSNQKNKSIKILEFWCGDGRFFREVLSEIVAEKNKSEKKNTLTIEYTGIDISDKLLKIAEKTASEQQKIKTRFICADIAEYIENIEQESYDIIVWIASFQHIKDYKTRLYLMKSFYKALYYDGIILMLNWSFSDWFIKKYWKSIAKGIKNYLISFGKVWWNDLELPWRTKGKTFLRFYHIFTLKEFRKLVLFSGFVLKKLTYITNDSKFSEKIKNARNSLFIAKKSIIK